jgi:hypothetical protein
MGLAGIAWVTALILKPIQVRTGSCDMEGRLVLQGDELVAVLVSLDNKIHGDDRGKWFLEASFGALSNRLPFIDLDEAISWLQAQLLR